MDFRLTGVCTGPGDLDVYASGGVNFDTTIDSLTEDDITTTAVLSGSDTNQPLTNGSALIITPNTDEIKPTFSVMNAELTVTGVDSVTITYYSPNGTVLGTETVSTWVFRFV